MVRLLVVWVMCWAAAAGAADEPFGVLDIALGTSYVRLNRALDFRDLDTALSQAETGKPDLGSRGYGCSRRDDEFADMACVSHTEQLAGVPTREIRLHFLAGRLQQFSLTAEVAHFDAVMAYLRGRFGTPSETAPTSVNAAPGYRWQSDSARIAAVRGKDLVFVNFELASYADAVKRKREGASALCS